MSELQQILKTVLFLIPKILVLYHLINTVFIPSISNIVSNLSLLSSLSSLLLTNLPFILFKLQTYHTLHKKVFENNNMYLITLGVGNTMISFCLSLPLTIIFSKKRKYIDSESFHRILLSGSLSYTFLFLLTHSEFFDYRLLVGGILFYFFYLFSGFRSFYIRHDCVELIDNEFGEFRWDDDDVVKLVIKVFDVFRNENDSDLNEIKDKDLGLVDRQSLNGNLVDGVNDEKIKFKDFKKDDVILKESNLNEKILEIEKETKESNVIERINENNPDGDKTKNKSEVCVENNLNPNIDSKSREKSRKKQFLNDNTPNKNIELNILENKSTISDQEAILDLEKSQKNSKKEMINLKEKKNDKMIEKLTGDNNRNNLPTSHPKENEDKLSIELKESEKDKIDCKFPLENLDTTKRNEENTDLVLENKTNSIKETTEQNITIETENFEKYKNIGLEFTQYLSKIITILYILFLKIPSYVVLEATTLLRKNKETGYIKRSHLSFISPLINLMGFYLIYIPKLELKIPQNTFIFSFLNSILLGIFLNYIIRKKKLFFIQDKYTFIVIKMYITELSRYIFIDFIKITEISGISARYASILIYPISSQLPHIILSFLLSRKGGFRTAAMGCLSLPIQEYTLTLPLYFLYILKKSESRVIDIYYDYIEIVGVTFIFGFPSLMIYNYEMRNKKLENELAGVLLFKYLLFCVFTAGIDIRL